MEYFAWILTSTGLLGFGSNIVQLVLICRDSRRKNSVFYQALLSLNIADLFASVLFLSQGLIYLLHNFSIIDSSSFNLIRRLLLAATIFSVTASFTHVIFIAVQRAIAVALPLKAKRLITKSRCRVVLILIWVVSIAPALSVYFYVKTKVVIFYLAMIACFVLIIVYSGISYKTIKRRNTRNESEEMQRRRLRTEKGLFLHSVAVTVIFVICNSPLLLMNFVRKIPLSFLIAADVLFTLNPFLDTVVYFAWGYYKRRGQARVNDTLSADNEPTRQRNSSIELTNRL